MPRRSWVPPPKAGPVVSQPSGSELENLPGHIWQSLETFLVVTTAATGI